jgi:catalase
MNEGENMNNSLTKIRWFTTGLILLAVSVLLFGITYEAETRELNGELNLARAENIAPRPAPTPNEDLAKQLFEIMLKAPGNKPGYRLVHAKGLVCQGTFTPSQNAATISKAVHFQGSSTPITVRFSGGPADPLIPDNAPNAGPQGMAIRFNLPGGEATDIVAISHNGFVVSSGEEFLALQQAVVATDRSKPHPWPIEEFLGARPLALKFVKDNAVIPASFANEPFFSNNAFVFVNKGGVKQAGRYKILPAAGIRHLSAAEAQTMPANFLIDDLKTHLATKPIKFRLVIQLPNPGDPTKDPSLVWPDDRKAIDVGEISVTSVAPDNDAAEKALAYDPMNLTDGIEPSDDPFPALRSRVYALAAAYRRQK